MIGCSRLLAAGLLAFPAACASPNQAVVAPAGAAAAPPAAAGSCPFGTRNWRATAAVSDDNSWLTVTGETSPDPTGHPAMLVVQLDAPAPDMLIALEPDPAGNQPEPWAAAGVGAFYFPAYTHVVIRCGGAEIARVPIRVGG